MSEGEKCGVRISPLDTDDNSWSKRCSSSEEPAQTTRRPVRSSPILSLWQEVSSFRFDAAEIG
jgi:hypothetical protein